MVVRPNPVLFQLPESDTEASKENQSPRATLPYRSVFAVLTLDSILIYDTHHSRPLSILRGLHYAGLTDCCWSRDGMNLVVCSTDGYISIVNFAEGELGTIYKQPMAVDAPKEETPKPTPIVVKPAEQLPVIPPCEPGQSAVLEAPPAKKAKKTRVTPTLISTSPGTLAPPSAESASKENASAKRASCTETESVGEGVTKLSLNGEKPKKKKRIQPLLISSN